PKVQCDERDRQKDGQDERELDRTLPTALASTSAHRKPMVCRRIASGCLGDSTGRQRGTLAEAWSDPFSSFWESPPVSRRLRWPTRAVRRDDLVPFPVHRRNPPKATATPRPLS